MKMWRQPLFPLAWCYLSFIGLVLSEGKVAEDGYCEVNDMGNQVCTSVDKDGHRTISILTKEHLNERDNMMKERAAKDKEDFYQPGEDTMNPSKCCEALLIQGTAHEDKFHHKLMGVYRLYKPMSWIEYTKKDRPHHPDLQGKYPVYLHNFANFTPSSERLHPQTSYLYYYLNTAKDQPENDICKVRGCWMIGINDPTPNSYWFGRKYYFTRTSPSPKCPEGLTSKKGRFINDQGRMETKMTITCLDAEQLEHHMKLEREIGEALFKKTFMSP